MKRLAPHSADPSAFDKPDNKTNGDPSLSVPHCIHPLRADAAFQHQAGAGAQFFGLRLELAAGGEDVAAARGAHGPCQPPLTWVRTATHQWIHPPRAPPTTPI